MALATGAQAEVGMIAEITYGTTPATPELAEVPATGFSPEVVKEGFQSGDLRADRQIADFRHGGKSTNFNVDVEMKHGPYDDLLAGALFGAWAGNVLKASTIRNSFTLEAAYTDIAQYLAFVGCMVNQFTMSVSTDATVTGSFSMVGKDMTPGGATIDTSGQYTKTTKRSFDSFSGTVDEGGAGSTIITGVELSLDNGLQPARAIGDSTPQQYFDGRSNLTGTVNAFFESMALLNKFLDETQSSLSFVLTDPDSNTLTFDVPKIVYTGGSPPVSGESGVVIALPFQAIYDSGEDTAFKITRSA